jgi:hypothetical protein
VQAPYLATSHHHAGSRVGLDEIQAAFFDDHEEEHELRALVFTDTLDETNGVAGTMRRLAAEGERGALPVRVATAGAEHSTSPSVIAFPPDWTLPLPTYERLELRFPLITDVLERIEAERPTSSTSRRPDRSASAASSPRGCSASRSSARTTPSSARTRCT